MLTVHVAVDLLCQDMAVKKAATAAVAAQGIDMNSRTYSRDLALQLKLASARYDRAGATYEETTYERYWTCPVNPHLMYI